MGDNYLANFWDLFLSRGITLADFHSDETISERVALLKISVIEFTITGDAIRFTDYLRNRSQRVVIDGVDFQYVPVTSGVPQGSPLLFVIFINDLTEFIPNQSKTALFADDTKLYRSISSSKRLRKPVA